MKLVLFISILFLVSCRTIKTDNDHTSVIRDSLIISNIQVVDTIKIEKKEITGGIPLDWFKAFGSYTIQDRGVKTEIRYVNDSIKVYTLVDSSLHLFIKQYLNSVQKSNNQSISTNKTKTKTGINTMQVLVWITLVLAIILSILFILKFLKNEFRSK